MNTFTTLTASVLLAAPLCMVAQAGDPAACQKEGVALFESLADAFEKATPDTLDQLYTDIETLKPRFVALRQAEAALSRSERKSMGANQEAVRKLGEAMMRLMTATQKLQSSLGAATPAQKAQMQKIGELLQNIMSSN